MPSDPAGEPRTEGPRTEGPRTEVGEATPAPPLMLGVLWVGAFSVVLWGMFLLFGTFRRGARPPAPPDDTDAP